MKITVFGPNGMLGQAVMKAALAQGHEVNPIQSRIEDAVSGHVRRSVVINCAGQVPQKRSTDANMVLTNAYAPHLLAEVCDLALVRLVHVSTDCVFSDSGPHDESDAVSPASFYGKTKAAGEVTRDQHLTVRVSFVGEASHGLVHDLRTQMSVDASRELLWSGHTVRTVAEYLVQLAVMSEIKGLLHMPGEWRSRYELVSALVGFLGLPTTVNSQTGFRADRRLASVRWQGLGLKTPPLFYDQLVAGGLL